MSESLNAGAKQWPDFNFICVNNDKQYYQDSLK